VSRTFERAPVDELHCSGGAFSRVYSHVNSTHTHLNLQHSTRTVPTKETNRVDGRGGVGRGLKVQPRTPLAVRCIGTALNSTCLPPCTHVINCTMHVASCSHAESQRLCESDGALLAVPAATLEAEEGLEAEEKLDQ
jgi:hypothetical protein